MSLDENGLTIKRYEEVVDDLNTGIKERLGTIVDTSEYSLIGNLHSNMALKLSELWELSQALYDAGNLYQAEGDALDNLALQVGVVRKPATRTTGNAYFEGADGVIVPANSRIGSEIGDEYFVNEDVTISSLNCVTTRVYVTVLENNTEYKINVDGIDYTYTSDADATEEEILTGLKTQLDLAGTITNTVVVDVDDATNTYLLIDKISKTQSMAVTGISYLIFDFIVTPDDISSVEYGAISGDALAVNEILSGVTNWYTVVNPSDLTLGDIEEDDNELRLRILEEFNAVGSGTVDSITTKILRTEGVTDAIVKENTSDVTDGEGIPPKSYEVVVNGGLDEDIAETIWSTKPAGIYTHGTEVVNITDFNGYDQTVRFSRADIKYVTVRVKYSVYSEEPFPAGAIDAAKQAILDYANQTLSMDDDVIAKRFLGPIYASSTGFGDIVIDVAYKDNPTDPVTEPDYADVLAISDRQTSSFALTRMLFETL